MPNHAVTIAIGYSRYDDDADEYAFDVDAFNNHGEWNFCDQVRPMPEEVKGDVPGMNPPCCPLWAKKNWGTKWGTYREKAYALGGDGCPVAIEFESAWGPPHMDCLADIEKWMNETLGIENVKFVHCNPYDNSVEFLGTAMNDLPTLSRVLAAISAHIEQADYQTVAEYKAAAAVREVVMGLMEEKPVDRQQPGG